MTSPIALQSLIGIWHLSRGEKEAQPPGDPDRVGRSGEREITLGVIDSNHMPDYTSKSSAWFVLKACAERSWAQGLGEYGRWLPIHSQPCLGRTGQYCCTFSIRIHIKQILSVRAYTPMKAFSRILASTWSLIVVYRDVRIRYAKIPVLPSAELVDH